MRVLILGARAPVCLEWARAFHGTGWHVTVADSLAFPLVRFSRTAQQFVRLPEPRIDPSVWIDALCTLVVEHHTDVLLPTCEEAFYLAHGRERLDSLCRVLTADFATMHRLHHKGLFAQLTQQWSVASPETHLLSTPDDLKPFFCAEASPWIFKPVYSRFAHQTLIRPTLAALAAVQPTPQQPWVAQRFVVGREHCSYSLLTNGRLTAHACYHPRYRVGRGAGIFFEPTDPAPVREFLVQFGAVTGYTGQVGFDFIENEDGCMHVLECNPRGTSGVHLFGDQPEALVNALLGEGSTAVLQPSSSPRMVTLAMLMFAAPRYAFSARFWRDFRSAHDVVVQGKDSWLLFAQVMGLIEVSARALHRRRGLLAASTEDIEWNGQALDTARP